MSHLPEPPLAQSSTISRTHAAIARLAVEKIGRTIILGSNLRGLVVDTRLLRHSFIINRSDRSPKRVDAILHLRQCVRLHLHCDGRDLRKLARYAMPVAARRPDVLHYRGSHWRATRSAKAGADYLPGYRPTSKEPFRYGPFGASYFPDRHSSRGNAMRRADSCGPSPAGEARRPEP